MQKPLPMLLALIFVWPPPAPAQEARFRDRNYLLIVPASNDPELNGLKSGLRLEGRLGADVTLVRGQEVLNSTLRARAGFLSLFRMAPSESSPIRTPSYIFNFDMEFDWHRFRLELTPFGHHSNGQDGCPLQTADGECVTHESILTADEKAQTRVNLEDGDFSTNYTRVGVRHVWNSSSPQEMSVGVEIEHNYESEGTGRFGTLREELGYRYGRNRWSVSTRANRELCGWILRAAYRFQHILGLRPEFGGNHYVHFLDAALLPDVDSEWGIYTRYYHGRDYYNIRFFAEPLNRLDIGVVWGADGGRRR